MIPGYALRKGSVSRCLKVSLSFQGGSKVRKMEAHPKEYTLAYVREK
jgi:hypothetical protein